jgi:hypothetical protein
MGPDNKGNYFNMKWQEFTGLDIDKLFDAECLAFIHPDKRNNIENHRRQ